MQAREFIKCFMPQVTNASWTEKLRSGLAGGVAILILGWLLHALPQGTYQLMMLGSIAASAVLIFAVPHSPLAQPWNLIGGHLLSALPAWFCGIWFADPLLAGALAVGLAIFLMYSLSCLHPPGAATALTVVMGSAQFHQMGAIWTIYIIAANALIFLVLAIIINNLIPGRRYPMDLRRAPVTPKPGPFIALEREDLEWSLTRMNSTIDINVNDLSRIYELALNRAQDRLEAHHSRSIN
jgi:CBS-domain-containing membrane protein